MGYSMNKELHSKFEKLNCPVKATLEVIGGKYKVMIIYHLLIQGTLRYNELQKLIPEATPRMLSTRLRELEDDGIVHREVYPEVPPKTEYTLTELGQSLTLVMDAFRQWGEKNLNVWGDSKIEPPHESANE